MKSWFWSITLTQVFQLSFSNAQDITINVASALAVPFMVYPHSLYYDGTGQFVYIAGHADATIDSQKFYGGNDAFLTKHYLNGTRVWSRIVGDSGNDFGEKVLQDPITFDVFLFGYSLSAAVDNQTNAGISDSLIVKFSSNGTKLFTRLVGTPNEDYIYDAFFDTEHQQLVLAGEYSYMFGITVNDINNGSLLKQLQFPALGQIHGIESIQGTNDCLITGWSYVSFDGQTNQGYNDIFLSKMNYANGTRYWYRLWGNSSDDYGLDVQFEPNTRRIFVTGYTTSGTSINGQTSFGNEDIVLICATNNGTHVWTRQLGTSLKDRGYAVAIHHSTGTLFLLGWSEKNYVGFVSTFYQNGTAKSPMVLSQGGDFRSLSFAGANLAYVCDYDGSFVTLNISSPPLNVLTTRAMTPGTTVQETMVSATQLLTSNIFDTMMITVTSVMSSPPPVSSSIQDSSTSDIFATTEVMSTSDVINVTGPNHLTPSTWTVIYVYVSLGFAGFLFATAFSCYLTWRCRRPHKQSQTVDETSEVSLATSDITQGEVSFSEVQPTSMNTLVRSSFGMLSFSLFSNDSLELSLPGFLMFDSNASFRITKQIARGGGGLVFLAEALAPSLSTFGRSIIVKTIGHDGGGQLSNLSEREQLSFRQEVAMMHFFRDDKHIAKLLGWSMSPVCILLKFYPLGSLDKWIHGPAYKSKLYQFHFTADISRGILSMHNAGFVHCDIKPQNVLVDTDERGRLYCCLTDFGITQVVDETTLLVKDFQVSSIKGLSTRYAAPEAFQRFRMRGAPSNIAADLVMKLDLYSFAMIVWELFEQRQPWLGRYRVN